MLEMMRLTDLRGRRIEALSGGQRQRVALARAIAPRPRVLLLDEPLSALDARLRDQLRQEIDALLRRLGITAVYVTHDQAEAMALGDRICAMEGGRIAQIGSARDLYHRPASEFVAGFVGDTNRIATRTGTLLVRPEELVLRPCPDGPFTVLRTTFLGPFVRVVIRHESGQELRADVPDDGAPTPGTRLSLSIRQHGSAQLTPLDPSGATLLPSS
jgi:putative spermidine/putrescine transport system ATP-binding protein